MENWAAWKVRQHAGAGRYASVNLADPTPKSTDPYSDAPVRPHEEDAWDIDAALRHVVVASDLRATIECHYLGRYTEREKLRRLNIAKTTLHDRLDRVDQLLVRHFGDKQAAAKQERERVEALQASMR
jgi:hypothetical protein